MQHFGKGGGANQHSHVGPSWVGNWAPLGLTNRGPPRPRSVPAWVPLGPHTGSGKPKMGPEWVLVGHCLGFGWIVKGQQIDLKFCYLCYFHRGN